LALELKKDKNPPELAVSLWAGKMQKLWLRVRRKEHSPFSALLAIARSLAVSKKTKSIFYDHQKREKRMNFIVENEELTLQYIPGNGAWTYQLIIPNTKDIKGKWGDLKVTGTIDGYKIKKKNLGPVKNSDKKMSINSEIRKAINKDGGDTVMVTLYLENQTETNDSSEILECFKDAQVLRIFERLDKIEQTEILKEIWNIATDDQKAEKIIKAIENLENKQR
jgi:hypothetical protein